MTAVTAIVVTKTEARFRAIQQELDEVGLIWSNTGETHTHTSNTYQRHIKHISNTDLIFGFVGYIWYSIFFLAKTCVALFRLRASIAFGTPSTGGWGTFFQWILMTGRWEVKNFVWEAVPGLLTWFKKMGLEACWSTLSTNYWNSVLQFQSWILMDILSSI